MGKGANLSGKCGLEQLHGFLCRVQIVFNVLRMIALTQVYTKLDLLYSFTYYTVGALSIIAAQLAHSRFSSFHNESILPVLPYLFSHTHSLVEK